MAVTSFGTPVMTRATSGSVTGAWGSGQARVAGAILVAMVTAGGTTASAAAISTPSGWTAGPAAGNTAGSANAWVASFWKVAAGSDSAPAFTATLSGTVAMTVTLLELAAGNCQAPADTSGVFASGPTTGTLSAMTVTTAGNVAGAGEYAITCYAQEAAAATNTWNPGAGWANAANDGATSTVLHSAVDYAAGPASGSALAETANWTANTSAFGAALILVIAAETGGTEIFANQATTTITAGGGTAPASGTAEYWTAASWSAFGTASNTASPPAHFHVADTAAGGSGELIAVLNTTTGLVVRGAEGTTPAAHSSGFTVEAVVAAGTMRTWPQVPPGTASSALLAAAGPGAAQAVTTATAAGSGGLTYGLAWTGSSSLPAWQLIRGSGQVATNQATASTSYSTIAGLSVASLPAGTYAFRAVVFCSSNNVSGVAQLSVSTPATSLLAYAGTTFSGAGAVGLTSAQSAAGNLGASNSNTTTYPVQIWGSFTSTVSGTFAVTFSTNSASFTTTALAGSWMEIVPA